MSTNENQPYQPQGPDFQPQPPTGGQQPEAGRQPYPQGSAPQPYPQGSAPQPYPTAAGQPYPQGSAPQQFSQAAAQPAPPMTAEQWAENFMRTQGREPTMSEYQNAVQQGAIAKERDPSLQQMGAGMKQVMAGAKNYYNTKIAPTAQSMGNSAAAAINEQRAHQPNIASKGWMDWMPIVLPIAALVSIISLFLPIVSALGLSASFFSSGYLTGSDGTLLLVLMIITILASAPLIFIRIPLTYIIAGVVGLIVGVLSMVVSFVYMARVGRFGASVGVGLIFLLLLSFVIIAASVIILVRLVQIRSAARANTPAQYPAAQAPAQQYPPAQNQPTQNPPSTQNPPTQTPPTQS